MIDEALALQGGRVLPGAQRKPDQVIQGQVRGVFRGDLGGVADSNPAVFLHPIAAEDEADAPGCQPGVMLVDQLVGQGQYGWVDFGPGDHIASTLSRIKTGAPSTSRISL